MLFILPAVFLIIGLGLGCGLLYGFSRTRTFLGSLEQARLCKAGSPVSGPIKIQGVAKAVDDKDLLISPIEQRPCVYYHLVIEEFHSSKSSRTPSAVPKRGPGSGSWVRLIDDKQAIPMVVADETGAVPIDANAARLDFKSNRRHANFLSKLPKELEQSLRERYKIVTSTFFIPKQMRYTEIVIPQDSEIFVHGNCEVEDGQATFDTKNHPLYLSFRKEKDLIRNSKISSVIMGAAGVLIPILSIYLAWRTYQSTSEQFGQQFKQLSDRPVAGKPNTAKSNIAKGKQIHRR
jgi:hypothetical protein